MAETFADFPLLLKAWLSAYGSHFAGHAANLAVGVLVAFFAYRRRGNRREFAWSRRDTLNAVVIVAVVDAFLMLIPAVVAVRKQLQAGDVRGNVVAIDGSHRPKISLYQPELSAPDRDFATFFRDTSVPIVNVANTGLEEAFDVEVEIDIPTNVYHHVTRVASKPRASLLPQQSAVLASDDLMYWSDQRFLGTGTQSFLFFLTQAHLAAPLQVHRRPGMKYPGDDGRLFSHLWVTARYSDRSNRRYTSRYAWRWHAAEREYRLTFDSDVVEETRLQ